MWLETRQFRRGRHLQSGKSEFLLRERGSPVTVPYVPIQPVAFLIPPDIQLGLDAGKLVRYGGIIRNQLGHIVTHLKEVPIPSKEPAMAQRVVSLLRDRRVVTVIVIGAATGGTAAAFALKNQVQARKCVKTLNASLVAYLRAARDGTLDEFTISRLITDLDAAEAFSTNGQVAVASELVALVMDYTHKLAEANSVDVSELQDGLPAADGATVIDLRRHLEVQQRIFAGAA